jgi:hypothetical protein
LAIAWVADDPVAAAGVAAGIQAAARELGAALTVRAEVASDAGVLPGRVARALVPRRSSGIAAGSKPPPASVMRTRMPAARACTVT